MSDFSDYYETKILDHMLKGSAFTPPANLYLALFTSSTGLETNSPSGEVSGNAYARQLVTFGAISTGASVMFSDIDVIFPAADPGNWGLITHVALVDHETNTTWGTNVNVLMWTDIASVTINAGDIFESLTGFTTASVA